MDAQKTINMLGYLAKKQEDEAMNFMKAYKLIWLADRYHLRNYGRTITGDRYFAMQRGLVPSDTKNIVEGENPRFHADHNLNKDAIQHDKICRKSYWKNSLPRLKYTISTTEPR